MPDYKENYNETKIMMMGILNNLKNYRKGDRETTQSFFKLKRTKKFFKIITDPYSQKGLILLYTKLAEYNKASEHAYLMCFFSLKEIASHISNGEDIKNEKLEDSINFTENLLNDLEIIEQKN